MFFKKYFLALSFLSVISIYQLFAELPLTHIKGLATLFKPEIADKPASGNIFSPIYGALTWNSPYPRNIWQFDSASATANLTKLLFNLHNDGTTFDVSYLPANTITHLSCYNIGYIIGLIYNFEQIIKQYQKNIPTDKKQEFINSLNEHIDALGIPFVKKNITDFYHGQLERIKKEITNEEQKEDPNEEQMQTLQTKKDSAEKIIKGEEDNDTVIAFKAYNDGKKAFLTNLVKSLLEERYLPHNTILLLLSCMWKKANSLEDIIQYMYGIYNALDNRTALFTNTINTTLTINTRPSHVFESQLVDIPSSITYETFTSTLMPLIDSQTYTIQNYQELKSFPMATLRNNLADFSFVFFGYDLFDKNLPNIVKMSGETKYREIVFSDCGETSLLNFFAALLYDPQTHAWNISVLDAINAEESLKDFFRHHSPITITTQAAHNAWAEVVSAKPGVSYVQQNICEINAGLENMLQVIAALIPGARSLQELVHILSPHINGLAIDEPKTGAPGETILSINLIKKNEPIIITWKFLPGHFELYYPVDKNDTRATLVESSNALNSESLPTLLVQQYTKLTTYVPYYRILLHNIFSNRTSADVDYDDTVIKIIKDISESNQDVRNKKDLIKNLYYEVPSWSTTYQKTFWEILTTNHIPIIDLIENKKLKKLSYIQSTAYIKALLNMPINQEIVNKLKIIAEETTSSQVKEQLLLSTLQLPITPEINALVELLYKYILTNLDISDECIEKTLLIQQNDNNKIFLRGAYRDIRKKLLVTPAAVLTSYEKFLSLLLLYKVEPENIVNLAAIEAYLKNNIQVIPLDKRESTLSLLLTIIPDEHNEPTLRAIYATIVNSIRMAEQPYNMGSKTIRSILSIPLLPIYAKILHQLYKLIEPFFLLSTDMLLFESYANRAKEIFTLATRAQSTRQKAQIFFLFGSMLYPEMIDIKDPNTGKTAVDALQDSLQALSDDAQEKQYIESAVLAGYKSKYPAADITGGLQNAFKKIGSIIKVDKPD